MASALQLDEDDHEPACSFRNATDAFAAVREINSYFI